MADQQSLIIRGNIPIFKPDLTVIGHFERITLAHAEDKATIQALVRWRQMAMHAFLTQFTATTERTEAWLKNVVLRDSSRILFLGYENGRLIGNFGACNIGQETADLDNFIRGEAVQEKRFIYHAVVSLCHWLFQALRRTALYCRYILSDNYRSVALHSSIGFTITELLRMTRETDRDTVQYTVHESESPDPGEMACVRMVLTKDRFYELHPFLLDPRASVS